MGDPDSSTIGVISILLTVGNIAATWPAQFVCDTFGRRWAIIFGGVFCIAAALVQTFSYSSGQYMVSPHAKVGPMRHRGCAVLVQN